MRYNISFISFLTAVAQRLCHSVSKPEGVGSILVCSSCILIEAEPKYGAGFRLPFVTFQCPLKYLQVVEINSSESSAIQHALWPSAAAALEIRKSKSFFLFSYKTLLACVHS